MRPLLARFKFLVRGSGEPTGHEVAEKNRRLKELRERLEKKDREIARLQLQLKGSEAEATGIGAGDIIWIFGHGRTGSTWLASMMGEFEDHAMWHEPYVGEIFGSAYFVRAWSRQREREGYILGLPYKEVWLRSIRAFVLDGANARFSEVAGNSYLVIKEPHGSIGAPLLMEALPESRMILLIRDPRDVAASRLDAHKKGSWTSKITNRDEDTLADKDPDAFIRAIISEYLRHVEKAKQAYDAHPEGRRALVKYEDLRNDTFGELNRICSSLGLLAEEKQLELVAEKHAWESIPENRKGQGKFYRKGTPGGWREDLTPEQVQIVERITAPIINEFYS
jgi:hypothetical protein